MVSSSSRRPAVSLYEAIRRWPISDARSSSSTPTFVSERPPIDPGERFPGSRSRRAIQAASRTRRAFRSRRCVSDRARGHRFRGLSAHSRSSRTPRQQSLRRARVLHRAHSVAPGGFERLHFSSRRLPLFRRRRQSPVTGKLKRPVTNDADELVSLAVPLENTTEFEGMLPIAQVAAFKALLCGAASVPADPSRTPTSSRGGPTTILHIVRASASSSASGTCEGRNPSGHAEQGAPVCSRQTARLRSAMLPENCLSQSTTTAMWTFASG